MNEQKAHAILLGLALGDALGYAVELESLTSIKQRYSQRGIEEPPHPALYSDDTQMTIALAEGLMDAGLIAPLDAQMKAVSARFIAWKNSPENNRAPGSTCMAGVSNLEQGLPWREAGLVESKGCGSAMRVAPIGYLYQNDLEKLRRVAEASSLLTHRHPAAVAASIAAAYAVALALEGISTAEYLPRIAQFVDGISEEFDQALRRVGHVGAWGDEERALAHIGKGWVGDEAVAMALYCVLRYPDDYVACVCRAANIDGDSDSVACIAGGIMGARLGMGALPVEWLQRLENYDGLVDLANRLEQAVELET
ncbi:MAG: ADP-ribosylglycohydrolase family protein [Aggregatilineales bacterium]